MHILTDGKLEHIFQCFEELWVAPVHLKINLPEIRSSIHAHFDVHSSTINSIVFLWLQAIFPVRSDWWPSHYLCPAIISQHKHVITGDIRHQTTQLLILITSSRKIRLFNMLEVKELTWQEEHHLLHYFQHWRTD